MQLTFASYNIHKAVGVDGKRDADRIIRVLLELDADVIALQEADLRFGSRAAVLPRALLDEAHYQVAPVSVRLASMGWHGNAILVRSGIDIEDAGQIKFPSLEPRGAVHARLRFEQVHFDVVGMHLDLSGLLRRRQIQAVCNAMRLTKDPSVMMGDLNDWSLFGSTINGFGKDRSILLPGKSFPSRRPLAALDRIVHSRRWSCVETHVHHSALAATASDHLPVKATLELDA